MNTSPTNSHALPPKFRLKLRIPLPSPSSSLAEFEEIGKSAQSRFNSLPSPVSTVAQKRSASPLNVKTKRLKLAGKAIATVSPTSEPPTSPSPANLESGSFIDQHSYSSSKDSKTHALEMMHYALSTNPHIKQNYTPVLILGYGGCGIVFEAVKKDDQEHVAIKIIYKSCSKTSVPSEVTILSNIKHPNIVKFRDHFEDRKAHYLVMEKFGKEWQRGPKIEDELVLIMPPGYSNLTVISGTSSSLFEYIDFNKMGRVPSRSVKPLFKQIASAVAYLHSKGIVHGDIKEENILIGTKGTRLVAKLCDFGHSYFVDPKNPRMKLYGTRVLTPPELLNHMRYENIPEYYCDDPYQLGYKQDIWALGIVLWTMIHGSLPPENDFYLKGEYDLSEYRNYPTSFASVQDPSKYSSNLVCLDLLKSMLCIDARDRFSAAQVIHHAYFF